MAKTTGTPPKSFIQDTPKEQKPYVQISNFLGGLFTDADPSIIPQDSLTTCDNIEFFRSMPFRRNGLNPWPITKPDSQPIQQVYGFFDNSTGLNILRFTRNKIYKSTSSGWVEFTPSGIAAMSGSNDDYFSNAIIDNRIFFTQNGADEIREIDAFAQTYKALGNAPKYRYICTAFNRIIGANLVDTTDIPFQIGWCGESNYDEWDPLTDISAGRQNLTSSPTSLTDDCTGILSAGQLLVLPRQNSMWLATHTQSATSPFSAFSALPHVGADLPRTIQLTDYGLVWVSNATSTVYIWTPGAAVPDLNEIELSSKIRRFFRVCLNNSNQVWASYSHETHIYTIYISYNTTSTIVAFSYNFITKGWSTSSFVGGATSVGDLDYSNSSITINDLTGTIDDLQGSINSLGGLTQNGIRVFGFGDGSISSQSPYSGLAPELPVLTLTDNGNSFTTTFALKLFELPPYNLNTPLIRFGIYPYSVGTVNVEYSQDDGQTWITQKTVTFTETISQQIILIKDSLKARRWMWRLTTNDCMFAVSDFVILPMEAGEAQE